MKMSGVMHAAQILFYLNAAIWLIFSAVSMVNLQYNPLPQY